MSRISWHTNNDQPLILAFTLDNARGPWRSMNIGPVLMHAIIHGLPWSMDVNIGALHTMAVDLHQSNCMKPRVQPLDPSHYGQSPKVVVI